jgi:hypothetical protein
MSADVAELAAAVLRDGFAGLPGAFEREWAQRLREDFDVLPLPGAVHQPWHRDFPMPEETRREGRLSSLAYNVTTVDVSPEMGPMGLRPVPLADGLRRHQGGHRQLHQEPLPAGARARHPRAPAL